MGSQSVSKTLKYNNQEDVCYIKKKIELLAIIVKYLISINILNLDIIRDI